VFLIVPIVYRCKRCGFILHVFVKVGQNSYGIPTPSELASQYGDQCPYCGRRLERPMLSDIIIKPNGFRELLATLEEARRSMHISFRGIERFIEELRRRTPVSTPASEASESLLDLSRDVAKGVGLEAGEEA
jgi:DNA-directed RNA polymerase subunit RPC12/RpoP